ncbi:hypothetical protein ES319_D01G069800v1 [Gossypium barbadense]|uniref:Uncharacterized protein n=1 Tax=Gossypium barbadense TaxID=3634 RepID=A0A5J5SKS3_GOSBA|nr:hypothetical protein ES319_D01G069800v1 [Gossypium barbadense]
MAKNRNKKKRNGVASMGVNDGTVPDLPQQWMLMRLEFKSLILLVQNYEEGTTDEEIEKCSEHEDGGKSYC